MKMYKYIYCFIGTALILFDRVTKLWAEQNLVVPKEVTSFFSWELAHNTGVSFSLFAHHGSVAFWFLTLSIIALLIAFIRVMVQRKRSGHNVIGEMLVVAGGFGNVCDRLWYGYVIDFIHVHYAGWSFPYFNVADICIVSGIGYIMVQLLIEEWKNKRT